MIYSQQESRVMLEEIENMGDGNLTDWESEFLDSVSTTDKLSPKQREIIDGIHTKTVRQRKMRSY